MTTTTTLSPEEIIEKQGHVWDVFAGFAANAKANTAEPIGYKEDKPGIPDGEIEFLYSPWSAPDGRADLHVWLAKPGTYEVDGAMRPNFFEVTSLMRGSVTVEEDGHGTVLLKQGDTYVMRPGWTGRWIVHEYVEKALVWVYTS